MGAVVSRGELSGPKGSEGGREAGDLSPGRREWVPVDPMACAPVWGSGEAETLIDPPNPPVSQKGKGSCCLL